MLQFLKKKRKEQKSKGMTSWKKNHSKRTKPGRQLVEWDSKERKDKLWSNSEKKEQKRKGIK